MDQDEGLLQEAFGSYAEDGLFWSLVYLNNAVFGTDFRTECRKKLLGISQGYETIMLSLYPAASCSGLIKAMKERNQIFADGEPRGGADAGHCDQYEGPELWGVYEHGPHLPPAGDGYVAVHVQRCYGAAKAETGIICGGASQKRGSAVFGIWRGWGREPEKFSENS